MSNYSSDRLLRVNEAAERLGLKPSTIRKMILLRRIAIVRPTPRSVRISEATIEAIIQKGYRPAIEGVR
jgi:excisionase family DNA binding protein